MPDVSGRVKRRVLPALFSGSAKTEKNEKGGAFFRNVWYNGAMSVRAVGRPAVILTVSTLLFACADMNALFSAGGGYGVRANVNGVSLETSSIIRTGDRISPYFAMPVGNDPDLVGLLVYLRNHRGEVVGNRVQYVIGTPAPGEDETAGGGAEPEDVSGDSPTGPPVAARWGVFGTSPPPAPPKDSDVEIAVSSFDRQLPCFRLPENLEMGSYCLVFEALGGRISLGRTEIPVFYIGDAEFELRDVFVSLPGLFDTRLIPPETNVLLEARLDFDPRLDPHIVWRNGRNVIREGRIRDGAGSVIWETPGQAAFHHLHVEVVPFRLRGHFAGISREILLPVSGSRADAGFFFGTGPGNPARIRLAEGTFHLEPAEYREYAEETGERAEAAPEPPELYSWHRFTGDLSDTVSARDGERFLVPSGGVAPLWVSLGASFGLSTGYGCAFTLPPVTFFREGQNSGGGVFLLHVRPVADGTVFGAFFPSEPPGAGAWLDLSSAGDAIVLRLGTAETAVETSAFSGPTGTRGLVPVAVKFYIDRYRLEASVALGEDVFAQSAVLGVELSGPLTGEGKVRLGGAPLGDLTRAATRTFAETASPACDAERDGSGTAPGNSDGVPYWEDREDRPQPECDAPERDGSETAAAPGAFRETAFDPAVATVWNEFAVMLSSSPFPRPVFPADAEARGEHLEETAVAAVSAPFPVLTQVQAPDTVPAPDSTPDRAQDTVSEAPLPPAATPEAFGLEPEPENAEGGVPEGENPAPEPPAERDGEATDAAEAENPEAGDETA